MKTCRPVHHPRQITRRARRISFALVFTIIVGLLATFTVGTDWTGTPLVSDAASTHTVQAESRSDTSLDDAANLTFSLVDLAHDLLR
jgi:hypothetical protein